MTPESYSELIAKYAFDIRAMRLEFGKRDADDTVCMSVGRLVFILDTLMLLAEDLVGDVDNGPVQ